MLAAKRIRAPIQPDAVSGGSETSSGPSRAAIRMRLAEMTDPSTAVTERKP